MATIALNPLRALAPLWALPYHWQAMLVVITGTFNVMLSMTLVQIALPRIIAVFQAPVHMAQFVLTGYMVAMAVVMPATGYLTDTYGTKRIYLASITLFTLGSALCGFAWDVQSLVAFRVLQGLGGGMLLPLGMTVIFRTAPVEQRGRVMGVFGLPVLFAPLIGPVLGGYLIDTVDWRIIFTLNLPVGALGLLLASAILREAERPPQRRFDLRGFVLAGLGFSTLLYGLATGSHDGWQALHVVAALAAGVLFVALWIGVELTTREPLLDLRVFRNRTYALATCVTFVVTVGMFSSVFLVPLFLQDVRGLGAMQTGLIMLPQALGAGIGMPVSGWLFDRFGPRRLTVAGLALLACVTWQLSRLDLNTPDSTIGAVFLLRGIAMGLVTMPATTVAMNTLPAALVARGSSLTNVLRQLSGAFGTAMFATLLQDRQSYHYAFLAQTVTPDVPTVQGTLATIQSWFTHQGAPLAEAKIRAITIIEREVTKQAAVQGFDDCFLVATVICVAGILPALFLRTKGAVSVVERSVALD